MLVAPKICLISVSYQNFTQIKLFTVTEPEFFLLARVHNLRVFIPSTIGAFGPSSQLKSPTGVPDDDKQRPTSFYGIHKVFLEHLGENYLRKWGVDFRCLRYPGEFYSMSQTPEIALECQQHLFQIEFLGIISADTEPGGGTTDYAVDIFKSAVKNEPYTCYLKPDSMLPMMHVDDCLKATKDFLETPSEVLDQVPGKRTYNVAAMSFTPKSISEVIRQHYPDFQVKVNHLTVVSLKSA